MRKAHWIFSLLLLIFTLSCSSKLESGDYTDEDVVGSYWFEGYSGPLKRTLEIVFEEDHSGYGSESSYSTSTGNLLSAHKFFFTWRKSQNTVYLSGAHASASSSGDIGANTDWSAEFEFKYGMFMPKKGFIEGYAEKMISGKMKRDVSERVTCTASYYTDSYSFGVVFSSDIPKIWPEYRMKCGFTCNYPNYNWLEMGQDEDIAFGFDDNAVRLYLRTIKSLNEKEANGGTLSQSERGLRASMYEHLEERLVEISKGKTGYTFAVSIGENVFEVDPILKVIENQKNPFWDPDE